MSHRQIFGDCVACKPIEFSRASDAATRLVVFLALSPVSTQHPVGFAHKSLGLRNALAQAGLAGLNLSSLLFAALRALFDVWHRGRTLLASNQARVRACRLRYRHMLMRNATGTGAARCGRSQTWIMPSKRNAAGKSDGEAPSATIRTRTSFHRALKLFGQSGDHTHP